MGNRVLRYCVDYESAKKEIESVGGRVILSFNGEALIAELPDYFNEKSLAASSKVPIGVISPATQVAVEAWIELQNEPPKAPDSTENLPWDSKGYQPPLNQFSNELLQAWKPKEDASTSSNGTPTSLYLIGSVAVGLVIVSRDHGPQHVTAVEQKKILKEVQTALDWLTTQEPRAKISFLLHINLVSVSAPPGPLSGETDPYERMEAPWRDAALRSMGYENGHTGYRKYVEKLKDSQKTKWAYVAFFTKYKCNHFAYAIYEKIVMEYSNDGWGPNNINRVFAHESCHIFGAADEYGKCQCGGSFGYLKVPNNNCVSCFTNGKKQRPCLMSGNTLSICDWSRRQIGWDKSLFGT